MTFREAIHRRQEIPSLEFHDATDVSSDRELGPLRLGRFHALAQQGLDFTPQLVTNFARYLVNVTESIRGVSVGPQMDIAGVQAFLRLAC